MSSHLEAEIFEQPRVFEGILASEGEKVAALVEAVRQRDIECVVIAARGSSDHAATYAKYLIESLVGVPVALAAPSLYTLYNRPPNLAKSLVMAISQSGESQDVRAVVGSAAQQGALTCAITNGGSGGVLPPLAREAEFHFAMNAGAEKAVAATKTYTAELLLAAWFAAAWAGDEALLAALPKVPGYFGEALQQQSAIARCAADFHPSSPGAVLGRGYHMVTALEIALKLKETCYLGIQGYSSADFLHGPWALVEPGTPVILVAPPGPTLAGMVEIADRVADHGARLMIITPDADLAARAEWHIPIPDDVPELLAPITYVAPGQLLALHLAQALGIDPDKPRNISKVTNTK